MEAGIAKPRAERRELGNVGRREIFHVRQRISAASRMPCGSIDPITLKVRRGPLAPAVRCLTRRSRRDACRAQRAQSGIRNESRNGNGASARAMHCEWVVLVVLARFDEPVTGPSPCSPEVHPWVL